jgi:hypothetical protein
MLGFCCVVFWILDGFELWMLGMEEIVCCWCRCRGTHQHLVGLGL